jgi:hypothetical protein
VTTRILRSARARAQHAEPERNDQHSTGQSARRSLAHGTPRAKAMR